MNFIDQFLNKLTMYKTVLYSLLVLALYAIILAFLGLLPFSGFALIVSLFIVFSLCYGFETIFAWIFKLPSNSESYAITALILFFLIDPPTDIKSLWPIVAASFLAILSKHILAYKKKHIFNPAAIAVVILGLVGSGAVSWWIGTPWLMPVVLILGLAVVRKIRRFELFASFVVVSTLGLIITSFIDKISVTDILLQSYLSGPLLFLGLFMLTEPATTPPSKKLQIVYGAVVGALFSCQFSFGFVYSTPELALIIGNIFSFMVSPKYKKILTFESKNKLSTSLYEFVFKADQPITYKPGQYMEWTLAHAGADSRGNRRYFTVASSPTEPTMRTGVRMHDTPSSFKKALHMLTPGQKIIAAQLSGDFILPTDQKQKMVFIAGGIGITPFRSMIKYLIDTKQARDIVLFYAAMSEDDFAYRDIFAEAEKNIGLKVIYIATNTESTWTGERGYLTDDMIKKYVPDYAERHFYLSGPNGMVNAYKKLLKQLHISSNHILTDYFPGF